MKPTGQPIIDTMIGFRYADARAHYDFITRQTKDEQSKSEFTFPAQYMFKDVPNSKLGDVADAVGYTIEQMDKWGIEKGMVGVGDADGTGAEALARYPDRFIPTAGCDPNKGTDGIRELRALHDQYGIRSVSAFPAGTFPQVAINDKKMYPIYATCVDLGIPIFCCAGIPGPRLRFEPQKVEYIDEVMYDFPDLVFVTRHGCEPWQDLAVKLMLKWPNLHYSTSAFAPKHYPKAIVEYANTRGADKIIYAGYFPMGLSLDRIMTEMDAVPFHDSVWPKFLYENAARVLEV